MMNESLWKKIREDAIVTALTDSVTVILSFFGVLDGSGFWIRMLLMLNIATALETCYRVKKLISKEKPSEKETE